MLRLERRVLHPRAAVNIDHLVAIFSEDCLRKQGRREKVVSGEQVLFGEHMSLRKAVR